MPVARFQMPDGRIGRFEVPEGTTPEQAQSMIQASLSRDPGVQGGGFDPMRDMSGSERFVAAMGKAFADTGRGIAGLVGMNDPEAIAESRRLDAPLMATGAGLAGNVTGHLLTALTPGLLVKTGAAALAAKNAAPRVASALGAAGSAMIAPQTIKGAAALGAGFGAVQPAIDMSERAQNIGLGGAAGAAGPAILRGAARVVSPRSTPQAQQLMAAGVTPTPGQLLGGAAKRAEEGLSSVPVVGDAIKAGQRRAAQELNVAAFNRALSPVGETLPKGLIGRSAVEHVEDVLGRKYNQLLPGLTTKADQTWSSEIANLRQMVRTGAIDPKAAQAFDRILKGDVLGKFQGQNAITGQTLKQIESDLTTQAKRLGQSSDADQRLVGDALREVQSSLRKLVQRTNPQKADELRAINTGWANFKRVQRAASGLGAEDGVFTPAQIQSAVKALDKSKDKARFASGQALMQDLSEAGKSVLGNTVPDSGTPYRSMMALGGGALAGGAIHPLAGAAVLAAPMLYSRTGQNALAAVLARRPDAAVPIGNALMRLAPYSAAPTIGFGTQ